MKIFISHKQQDVNYAKEVKQTLASCGVDAYLDLLDDTISGDGEKLTQHIRSKISECSDVIVILSEKTKTSWWVPFEIGMASEKDMPIANYLVSYITLPEYLAYWPRLKNQSDVKKYAEIRDSVSQEFRKSKEVYESASVYGRSETQVFYQQLKKSL